MYLDTTVFYSCLYPFFWHNGQILPEAVCDVHGVEGTLFDVYNPIQLLIRLGLHEIFPCKLNLITTLLLGCV